MGVFRQAPVPPLPSDLTLEGKTIIITGANAGLGYAVAREVLLLKAARLVLAVRNVSKGEKAKQDLIDDSEIATVNSTAVLDVMAVDMEKLESVVAFANAVKSKFERVDCVLLNAGIVYMRYETTTDGYEKCLQVNYLASALLAVELLPLLQETAARTGTPARLTWISSESLAYAAYTNISSQKHVIGYLNSKETYNSNTRYSDTKLLASAFIAELASRFPSNEVIINSVCPGRSSFMSMARELR